MKYWLVCIPLLALHPTAAADFSGYVALTSDYVKRGVSQSDGHAALQLGGDIFFDSGWYLGAWGSSVDIQGGPTQQRDQEVNLYAGYAVDVSDLWRVSAQLVSYEYPGQAGNFDYDHVEYSVTANFDDRIWIEYSHSPDLYNTRRNSENLELYAELPLTDSWSVGGGAGYYDVSDLVGIGYGYWQLGVTGRFRYASIDFRYHDTNRAVAIISTDDRSQARLAITIEVPF